MTKAQEDTRVKRLCLWTLVALVVAGAMLVLSTTALAKTSDPPDPPHVISLQVGEHVVVHCTTGDLTDVDWMGRALLTQCQESQLAADEWVWSHITLNGGDILWIDCAEGRLVPDPVSSLRLFTCEQE